MKLGSRYNKHETFSVLPEGRTATATAVARITAAFPKASRNPASAGGRKPLRACCSPRAAQAPTPTQPTRHVTRNNTWCVLLVHANHYTNIYRSKISTGLDNVIQNASITCIICKYTHEQKKKPPRFCFACGRTRIYYMYY